ncbi:MAG: FtsQ-type POTRA domain-containing protein [Oscillospiraceae bacterium]|nr:FtsQ-type POTRA domain-containing protein [Candidatus Limimonas coprohippi]
MPENMSKEEQRREHRNQRQRQHRTRMQFFYIALIAVVLIIGLVLSFTVFFHVSKMEVRGYSIYTESEILGVSGVNKGDNLFLINQDKVKEHITKKLPYIGEISVKIALPNKIIITVYETSIKSVIEVKDGYVLLDENGKVLGKSPSLDDLYDKGVLEGGKTFAEAEAEESTEEVTEEATSEETSEALEKVTDSEKPTYVLYDKSLVVLKGLKVKEAKPGKTIVFKNDKEVKTYVEIMNLFMENEITGITELDLSDVYNIVMKYEDRIDVKIGSVTNLTDKMAFAAKVIKEQDAATPDQEGVIDLTIDKKAYFQPLTSTTLPPSTTTTLPLEAVEETTTPPETTEPQTNSSGKPIQVASTTSKPQ